MENKIFNTVNPPPSVCHIIEMLEHAGYEAYVVGGCVRDSVLGKKPKDWDICTNAFPGEIEEVFADHYKIIETGIKHGTVTVMYQDEGYEITTYRIDGGYLDHRHPSSVTFTGSLVDDLARRDFTINAMAFRNIDEGIIDPFNGLHDLQWGIISCVGNPKERFEEDALRIMRALRFASTYGFNIKPSTKAAISECKELLNYVSVERIQSEFCKLLLGKNPAGILFFAYRAYMCTVRVYARYTFFGVLPHFYFLFSGTTSASIRLISGPLYFLNLMIA